MIEKENSKDALRRMLTKEDLFSRANQILIDSLNSLYQTDYTELAPPRLSAAFRRGDLFEKIQIT